MGSMNNQQAFKLLDAYVASEGNFLDTASHYQYQGFEI
jgi:aryl-alcohol dehydrogenase-like predicted oxidoreductase